MASLSWVLAEDPPLSFGLLSRAWCPAGHDTLVAARIGQWLGWTREGCSLLCLDLYPYAHPRELWKDPGFAIS